MIRGKEKERVSPNGLSIPRKGIRIGAVSYLNTKPLIDSLPSYLKSDEEVSLDLPSRLATKLMDRNLDVALIPSVEWMRNPSLHLVSDACIACAGEVWSVKLLFRVAPQEVNSLALDEGSRTSAALAQVLLFQRFGIRPRTMPFAMEQDLRSVDADAVLVIGDRAMHISATPAVQCQGFETIWDLGSEWWRDTGLPFVFAAWVGHAEMLGTELDRILERARDDGCNRARELAHRFAPRYGIPEEQCYRYFTQHLHFRLSDAMWAGMRSFYEMARQLAFVHDFHPAFSQAVEVAP